MANLQKAIAELKAIGVPLIENEDGVFISAENNVNEIWADYYMMGMGNSFVDDFGVNHKINAVLEGNGYFAEWKNPGCLNICEV